LANGDYNGEVVIWTRFLENLDNWRKWRKEGMLEIMAYAIIKEAINGLDDQLQMPG